MSILLPLLLLAGCSRVAVEQVGACATADTGARRAVLHDTSDGDPAVTAEVVGDDVILHILDAWVQCGADPTASASAEGASYTVEVAANGDAKCMCVADFDVTVENVPSGDWTFTVVLDGEPFGAVAVTVP